MHIRRKKTYRPASRSRYNGTRSRSSDTDINPMEQRFQDDEMSSAQGGAIRVLNNASRDARQYSTSPARLSSRSRSRPHSASSVTRWFIGSDSSESDTTWNPSYSLSEIDRFSDELERLSDLPQHSRHYSTDRSDSFSSGFMPSSSTSRTRSRSRNRSLSRVTSTSRSSRILSR